MKDGDRVRLLIISPMGRTHRWLTGVLDVTMGQVGRVVLDKPTRLPPDYQRWTVWDGPLRLLKGVA